MKLDKKLVDELIRITKKYYRTGDTDLLVARSKAEENLGYRKGHWVSIDLISNLAMFTQRSGKGTYEDIYKALAIFGIEVEEIE